MTRLRRPVFAAMVTILGACTADPNGDGREIEAPIGRDRG